MFLGKRPEKHSPKTLWTKTKTNGQKQKPSKLKWSPTGLKPRPCGYHSQKNIEISQHQHRCVSYKLQCGTLLCLFSLANQSVTLDKLSRPIVGFHMTSLKLKLKTIDQSYRDFTFTMH